MPKKKLHYYVHFSPEQGHDLNLPRPLFELGSIHVWKSEPTNSYRTTAKVLPASQKCIQAHQKPPQSPKSVCRCTKSLTLIVYPYATKVLPTLQKVYPVETKSLPPPPQKKKCSAPIVLPAPKSVSRCTKSLANPLKCIKAHQ
jgi:hypothetical protein